MSERRRKLLAGQRAFATTVVTSGQEATEAAMEGARAFAPAPRALPPPPRPPRPPHSPVRQTAGQGCGIRGVGAGRWPRCGCHLRLSYRCDIVLRGVEARLDAEELRLSASADPG